MPFKASTAIINPNEPGSTQLKLSWIWQTSGGHRLGLAGGIAPGNPEHNIIECMSLDLSPCLCLFRNSPAGPLAPCSCPTYEMEGRADTDQLRNAMDSQVLPLQ
jgi:hypothetical protein